MRYLGLRGLGIRQVNMNDRLNRLENDLGTEGARDLLKLAIPFIQEREAELQKLLLSGELNEASKYAHKVIGSLGVYGTDELERLLRKVGQVKNNKSELFELRESLSTEFMCVLNQINYWLDGQQKNGRL